MFFPTLGHFHSVTYLLASSVQITACLSVTLLAALVPVTGVESYYYIPEKHFHFLWLLRWLILCFVPFQIMRFSHFTFSFVVIMKLVLKYNNKMCTHLFLWSLIMTLPAINKLLWESQKYCHKYAVMVYWLISKELKSWLALFVGWLKQWDRKYWTD